MDTKGIIEIRITGAKGNLELSPDNYDIRDVIDILEHAEDLLYPAQKKDRPQISYRLDGGSVKHLLKTSLQTIIGFNAILGQISQSQSIDFLDIPAAQALEYMQDTAIKKDYTFAITTSVADTYELRIDRTTKLFRTEAAWVDAEFYFYGKVIDAGGKDKANIHLVTADTGTIRIATPINFLEGYETNILYRTFGIRALGKQHSETGEIDKNSLKFIELIDYQPKYDEQYLMGLRASAKKSWLSSINPDEWLKQIRGGYDA